MIGQQVGAPAPRQGGVECAQRIEYGAALGSGVLAADARSTGHAPDHGAQRQFAPIAVRRAAFANAAAQHHFDPAAAPFDVKARQVVGRCQCQAPVVADGEGAELEGRIERHGSTPGQMSRRSCPAGMKHP